MLESSAETYHEDTTEFTLSHETHGAGGAATSSRSVRHQRVVVGQVLHQGNPVDVWRYVPIESTEGEGAEARMSTEAVYDQTALVGSRGRVRLRQTSGQPWERYEYDALGNRIRTIIQMGAQPPTGAASLNREIEVQSGTYDLPGQARDVPAGVTQLMGQLFIERELGVEISRRYRLAHDGPRPGQYGGSIRRVFDIRCPSPGAASSAASNLVTPLPARRPPTAPTPAAAAFIRLWRGTTTRPPTPCRRMAR